MAAPLLPFTLACVCCGEVIGEGARRGRELGLVETFGDSRKEGKSALEAIVACLPTDERLLAAYFSSPCTFSGKKIRQLLLILQISAIGSRNWVAANID